MQKLLFTLLTLAFLCSTGLPAQATADVPGAEDHHLLTRYPGSHIAWYATEKYFEYTLATGPVTGYRYIGETEKHAGQLYRIYYEVAGSPEEVSVGEVYADYVRALDEAGVSIIAKGLFNTSNNSGKVGGSQWRGIALTPQRLKGGSPANTLFAGTATSGGTFAILGRVDRPTGPVYVAIYGERHNDKMVNYLVDILETKDAELGQVSINPDYLAKALAARGSVSIYGLAFDFDSANLQPESEPTLEQIAAYLRQSPAVKLYVVGHTDMTGDLAYNRKLSGERAAAVVKALEEKHGIEEGRLLADGVAFLAPKATNDSEDGRALNRRVELVLRK